MKIVQVFLETFSNERFVVPICTAMGFAYVLRHTGCDQHLVHLLVRPLRRVRGLLIPGTVLVAFLVNIPVISQTSTAVTVGAVAIPILLAARLSPVTVGAILLVGSSIGGELLNPGAPELRTIIEESRSKAGVVVSEHDCRQYLLPLDLLGLGVATLVLWVLCVRAESRCRNHEDDTQASETEPALRVDLLRAVIPLLPLLFLFLTGPPLTVLRVPEPWLVEPAEPLLSPGERGLYNSRLIGAAMLLGVVVAGLVVRQAALGVARAFFEGAGFGFTHIISLIVVANCFGEGIKLIGLADEIGKFVQQTTWLLVATAGVLSMGFAVLCGSGMATTQSLFPFLAQPSLDVGVDPALVGSVVALAAAAGRTMSPVAAVTLMCAALTKTNPLELIKRVAGPLLAGMVAIVTGAIIMVMNR